MTNFAGISNVVSFTPMERREGKFVVFLMDIGIESLEPSIQCTLFDLKVLIFFLVIPWVITAGMKMSFAPGFDKGVGVDGGFGGIVTKQKSFGGLTLLKNGIDVQGNKMLVDGTWNGGIFLMITRMGQDDFSFVFFLADGLRRMIIQGYFFEEEIDFAAEIQIAYNASYFIG